MGKAPFNCPFAWVKVFKNGDRSKRWKGIHKILIQNKKTILKIIPLV